MAFDFPDSYRYADSHEYAWQDADAVRIGLSAYAVDQLGDIVFVDLLLKNRLQYFNLTKQNIVHTFTKIPAFTL